MTRYTSVTDSDREQMLAAIGVSSVEELFADIPAGVRLARALDLPDGQSETEVYDALADAPEKVNEDPYGDGWLVRVKLSDPSEVDGLLDVGAYQELVKGAA